MWALGCVLFEMMSLKHAFDASSMHSLISKVLRGVVPTMPTHYSIGLQEIAKSLLNKYPNKRPSCYALIQNPFIKKAIDDRQAPTPKKSPVEQAADDKENILESFGNFLENFESQM